MEVSWRRTAMENGREFFSPEIVLSDPTPLSEPFVGINGWAGCLRRQPGVAQVLAWRNGLSEPPIVLGDQQFSPIRSVVDAVDDHVLAFGEQTFLQIRSDGVTIVQTRSASPRFAKVSPDGGRIAWIEGDRGRVCVASLPSWEQLDIRIPPSLTLFWVDAMILGTSRVLYEDDVEVGVEIQFTDTTGREKPLTVLTSRRAISQVVSAIGGHLFFSASTFLGSSPEQAARFKAESDPIALGTAGVWYARTEGMALLSTECVSNEVPLGALVATGGTVVFEAQRSAGSVLVSASTGLEVGHRLGFRLGRFAVLQDGTLLVRTFDDRGYHIGVVRHAVTSAAKL
jgi:hypothetical protein